MSRHRRPAEGERAAIGGYYPQYLLSSDLVLRRLDEGRLEWVRLADPEAGRLDDFQIGTPARLDAYQFKWSGQPGTFNFSDLIQETRDSQTNQLLRPSLIAQLADGLQRLRAARSGRRVVVHLVTNDIPGPNTAQIPTGNPPPARRTFAAFLSEGWAAARARVTTPAWQPALDRLRTLTGLSTNDFTDFLRNCELEFGASLPVQTAETREATLRWTNLRVLVAFLQATIQEGNVVEMRSEQLLRSLGWEGRYASRFRHEFPDPNMPYLPINTTAAQLEGRIAGLPGGYLAVIGPPGSGKSVLLTQTLRRPRQERVIRYYAYVPDAQDPAASRGDSVNFLHDVCLSLQQAGMSTEGTHLPADRELLLDRFHRQLALLGDEYRTSGRKTIILIDGLDHIDRELHPSRSLLADLPRPDQVPDGLFLVLGSQTDNLADLSERIRHALEQDGRRIQIDRLDRTAVREVVQNSGLRVQLAPGQLDRVFELSDGHPLALGYLVRALRGATEAGQVEPLLSSTEPYRGDIEAQYRTYWQAVRNDTALGLLAAVARLRRGADLQLLARWYGEEPVRRLVEVFRRYFVEEPDGRWRFFHNSFRVFLYRETARSLSGDFREALDLQAHRDLAERFAAEPADSADRWEELYHRVSASDHDGVCRLATQAYFRAQVFALRPLEAVKADIEIALPSAAAREDIRAYTAMTLSQAELAQRRRLLDDLDLSGLLLELGETELAVEAARDGNRLRIGITSALELAVQLNAEGETAEARRLFELAEPLNLLAGQGGQGTGADGWRLVDSWAAAATRFRPLGEVLDILAAVPLESLRLGNADETAETRLRTRLLTTVGYTAVSGARWDDLELVLARIPDNENGRQGRFWLLLEAGRASRGEQRLRFIERLQGDFPVVQLNPAQQLYLAELLLRGGDEAGARELVARLPLQTPNLDEPRLQDEGFSAFAPLLEHARVLYQLGDTRGPMQMVPDGSVTDRGGRIWFLRDVVIVGRIRARARTGSPLSAWDVRQEVTGIMQRFNRSFEGSDEWLGWIDCRKARGELYQALVTAVAEHGRDALCALRDEFERQWQGDTLRYWPTDVRRQVALGFAGMHEEHREWAVGHVRSIGEDLPWADLHGLVHESQEQARAWMALGDAEEAIRLIQRVVRQANGIVGEDYQFNTWLDWLDRLGAAEPETAVGLLDWFARTMVVLKETGDGVASSAGYRLIRVAARLDPGRSLALSRWLMDQGVVDHADRVKAVLEGIVEDPAFPARLGTYALADLVIPFDTGADENLAKAIVLAVHRVAGRQTAVWAVEYLAPRIAVYALPSARGGWEEGVREAAVQLRIVPPVPTTAPLVPCRQEDRNDGLMERRPPDRLVLDDGSELSLEEVLRRGADIDALAALARRERYNSDFDWNAFIDRLSLNPMSRVLPLVRAMPYKRKILTNFLARSRACREANDVAGAWGFARLALEATDRFGWSRRHGDGSRLDASRTLVDARPSEGRRELWRLLITEPGTDPGALEEIHSLLRDEPTVLEVWPEVEDYVHALFDEHLAADGAPECDWSGRSALPATALARMLLDDIGHPVAMLSRAARRACVLALLDGGPEITAELRPLLNADHRGCRAALEVLDTATRMNPALVANLFGELQALIEARDATVAVMATQLCDRGEVTSTPASAALRMSLPEGYGIILPPNALRGLIRSDVPENGQPWPDTEDPRQLLAVAAWFYRVLAERTGISEITLLCRGAKLMEEVLPRSSWCAQGERELHRCIGDAGLKFRFRRPRSDAAFQATSRLIGELWRAGNIADQEVRLLVHYLRLCDPALVLAEPAVRPSEILTIPHEMWGDTKAGAWVEDVGSALPRLPACLGDGRIVLAEVSCLEAIGRGLRTEQRLSVLCTETEADLGEEDVIPQVRDIRVSHYLTAAPGDRPRSLVIRHSTGATDENPAGNWVAFNPTLGHALGWNLAAQGLFRWTDKDDQVMVESLWWLDGPIGRRGMLAENCVGEGWLVVASPAAMQAIATRQAGLRRVLSVRRSAALDNGEARAKSVRQNNEA